MIRLRRIVQCFAFSLGALLSATACRTAPVEPATAPGESVFYTFEKFSPGSLPATWAEFASASVANASSPLPTSRDAASGWRVENVDKAASGARAFVHSGAQTAAVAPVWIRNAHYKTVKIHVMARCQDAADFAVIWRVSSDKNFLAFRINRATNSLTIERCVNGASAVLARTSYPFSSGQWIPLSIEHAGDRIQCGVAGAILLDATLADGPPQGSAGFCQYAGATRVELDNFSVIGERGM